MRSGNVANMFVELLELDTTTADIVIGALDNCSMFDPQEHVYAEGLPFVEAAQRFAAHYGAQLPALADAAAVLDRTIADWELIYSDAAV